MNVLENLLRIFDLFILKAIKITCFFLFLSLLFVKEKNQALV